MQLFPTSSLLLLFFSLGKQLFGQFKSKPQATILIGDYLFAALSNVNAKGPERKFKVVYDKGFCLIELRNPSIFWFFTNANENADGEEYGNGTAALHFESGLDAKERFVKLDLVHNPEMPSLDDLSFVLENGPTGTEKCDLAPAFQNLAEKCTGNKDGGWK